MALLKAKRPYRAAATLNRALLEPGARASAVTVAELARGAGSNRVIDASSDGPYRGRFLKR